MRNEVPASWDDGLRVHHDMLRSEVTNETSQQGRIFINVDSSLTDEQHYFREEMSIPVDGQNLIVQMNLKTYLENLAHKIYHIAYHHELRIVETPK